MIKIIDTAFRHADQNGYTVSVGGRLSKEIQWKRSLKKRIIDDIPYFDKNEFIPNELVFFTDKCVQEVLNYKDVKIRRVAWLIEPPEKIPSIYNWVNLNNGLFKYILTYDNNLLSRGENFKYWPFGTCWIADNDIKIWKKSKLLSTVMSDKRQTSQHKLRFDLNEAGLYENVDVYGKGGNISIPNAEDKIKSLKDYMFQISIDIRQESYGFTEKLIDCFATGTIPIYCGTDISQWFNMDGVIVFKNIEEFRRIKPTISKELYQSKMAAIEDNFQRCQAYLTMEKWLFTNFISKI